MKKIITTKKKEDATRFHVVIFGSARLKPDDPVYRKVYDLAKRLAAKGMDVVTGGGPGLMEASNKGCQEGRKNLDVRSYGINVKLLKPQTTNQHLDIKKEFNRFSQRLDYFMYLADAIVVAPGGIGTMLELMYTWQLIQVQDIIHVPIILLGDGYAALLKWFKKNPLKNSLVSPEDFRMIHVARDNKEAMNIILTRYQYFLTQKKRPKTHYAKYKI
ncbi:LOG family protein [Candidatus Peregrinibacteria bacterium]|nr:LOG family protein [Candidatus Peregrinibacteria bacterium]